MTSNAIIPLNTDQSSRHLMPAVKSEQDSLPEMREEMGIIQRLVAEFSKEREELQSVAELFRRQSVRKLYSLLSGYDHSITEKSELCAEYSLRSEYWKRVMALTDVLSVMTSEKRQAWNEQFCFDRYSMRDGSKQVIPDFTAEAVIPTVMGLLNDRNQFMRERVYGVFTSLSRSHKTNKAFGFSTRMIITGVCEMVKRFNGPSQPDFKSRNIEPLSELRVVCAFFRQSKVCDVLDTARLVERCVHQYGFRQWIDIDGYAVRFRVYKNGSMHIEINQTLAEQMNNILSAFVPLALPAERHKEKLKQAREFPLKKNVLDFDSRMQLGEMKFSYSEREKCWAAFRSGGYLSLDKGTDTILHDVFRTIGARVENYYVYMDYCPDEILRYLSQVGAMPDQVAHQLYQSSRKISDYVAGLLSMGEGDTLLEPSAGQGALLQSFSKAADIHCIEVDQLNALILKAKGFDVEEADFLAWSKANPGKKFSHIAINPPFSENRARLHLLAAATHLAPGGCMAAVLPLSFRHEDALLGDEFSWDLVHEFKNEFEDTSITVCVVYIQRIT